MTEAPTDFPYEEFWYVRGSADSKMPARAWGGYSQSFEAAEHVHGHSDVEMFPHGTWLVPALRNTRGIRQHLLVFDIDLYKAPDGFDADRVSVPATTPVVKSPSGGLHIYTAVTQSSRAKEADFEVVQDIPFDIDIRGEFVKHHVVAPAAVPGVETAYELQVDTGLERSADPDELAAMIKFDGDRLLEYNPTGPSRRGTNYSREDVDPPDDMPACYGAGLQLRAKAPDTPSLNTHHVNVLTALCGLAAGYDTDTVADHFIEEYYPGKPANADREKSEYHITHIAGKLDSGQYAPPAPQTLVNAGIMPEGEWCDCGIPGHHGYPKAVNPVDKSEYFAFDLWGLADDHDIEIDTDTGFLRACLVARDEWPALDGATPPYQALAAVAELADLSFTDAADGIMGEQTYGVAERIYADLTPSDV